MSFSLFTVLLIFIFISQNIILINEETLILICFTFVISIFKHHFQSLIDSIFSQYVSKIQKEINLSFKQLTQILEQTIDLANKSAFLSNINFFKRYYILLLKNFIWWMSQKTLVTALSLYPIWFNSFQNLECRLLKLILISLRIKLHHYVLLEDFLNQHFTIKRFTGQNLLVLREWFYRNPINQNKTFKI